MSEKWYYITPPQQSFAGLPVCTQIEDLQADFEQNRISYYEKLSPPIDPDTFILKLQNDMAAPLKALDGNLPQQMIILI